MEESEIQKYIDFIKQHLDLNDVEEAIIRGTLGKKTYDEMAAIFHHSERCLRDRGSKLWKRLSKHFGHGIKKTTFLVTIQQMYSDRQTLAPSIYVNREPIETMACAANIQPGSLIRIKAPQKMGKTLLSGYILADAENRGFKTAICDFGLFDSSKYENYEELLTSFCNVIIESLKLDVNQKINLSENKYGINKAVERLFDGHILDRSANLVLVLENFDKVLKQEKISQDFCGLLRHFYDKSKRNPDNCWERLHLIIIYSTDIYGMITNNGSPLAGVGEDFELEMFDNQQIKELFSQHKLSLDDEDTINQITELIGGHPYLLTLAITKIRRKTVSWEKLLKDAPTEGGIFKYHLRSLFDILSLDSNLKEAYKKVINADLPIELSTNKPLSFKLYSLGLIKQEGNLVSPSCNLYKKYFQRCLK